MNGQDGYETAARPDGGAPPLPPRAVEAEEALLGSVLINPDAYTWVQGVVEPGDFFVVRHGWIWEAIAALRARHEAVDALTVAAALRDRGRLAEAGGPAYLAGLIANTPTSMHAESYARLVARTALRRRALDLAGELARLAHDGAVEADALVARAYAGVAALDETRAQGGGLRPLREALSALYDRVEAVLLAQDSQDGPPGLATGFADLDALLGGLEAADLALVVARPGVGKSVFVLNLAEHAARQGRTVALFSLEMAAVQLAARSLSGATGLNTQKLRTGRLTGAEWAAAVGGFETLSAGVGERLFVDDRGGLTAAQVRAEALRLKARVGRVDVVCVDYTQLVAAETRASRYEEVTRTSIDLKTLARELGCPVVAAAQLSRKSEDRRDKRPQLADIRDSGQLEQDADVILGLYRDVEGEEPNVVEVSVLKHRHGTAGGVVRLVFRPDAMRFEAIAKRPVPVGLW